MSNYKDLCKISSDELFFSAASLRAKHWGREVKLCSIINIRSGYCAMDCKFCAQSSLVRNPLPRYKLLPDLELKKRIDALMAMPVSNIGLVASGAALDGQEFERLCVFIDNLPLAVKERICLSAGRISKVQMSELLGVGLKHYHHNLEASRSFYPQICSSQTWESRYLTVENALNTGFEVCSGGISGLGETWRDRIELALSLKEIGVRNIPLNFLHPVKTTSLGARTPMEIEEALRVVAIFRHILPESTLRICGGRTIVFADQQYRTIEAGANALMTGDFLTTNGEEFSADLKNIQEHGFSLTVPKEYSQSK